MNLQYLVINVLYYHTIRLFSSLIESYSVFLYCCNYYFYFVLGSLQLGSFALVQVGDFGILVMSGFSVPKALFFNFLSALVALAGTAMVSLSSQGWQNPLLLLVCQRFEREIYFLLLLQALLLGKDPGQSSFIEVRKSLGKECVC